MKKTRRFLGIVMACLMICLPAMQALAQTYDASVMDPTPVLFPGDELTGILVPVTLDGEPVALGEGETAWTNDSEGKVYSAAAAEDGSVALTLAGYELDVIGGTSEADETAEAVGGHYVPAADEVLDENAPKKDRAYYPAYTLVKIKADEPEEGMEFDKWTVEPQGSDIVLTDELSSETTLTMPEKKASITANYRPVQAEVPADPNAEIPADPNAEVPADPNAEVPTDPNVEVPADPNVEVPADPNVEVPADSNVEVPADPNAEVPVDPNVEGTGEPDVVVVGDGVDPNTEIPADPDAGIPADSIFDGAGDDEAFPITTNDEYNSDPEIADMSGSGLGLGSLDLYTLDVYRGTVDGQSAAGTVPESYAFQAGTSVTVTANDYSMNGYTFSYWQIEGNITPDPADNVSPFSFTMPESGVTLTAQYVDANGTPVADPEVAPLVQTRKLAVNSGTATVDGAALTLPGDVEVGKTVTVTAVDNTEQAHRFTGWTASTTDAATGEDIQVDSISFTAGADPLTASFEMPDMDLTVTAGYEPITYIVTMEDGNGTVVSENGTNDQTASFTAGTVVTVEASDKTAEGSEFLGWTVTSDDGSVTGDSVGLSTDAGNPYKATFSMPAVNVTVAASYGPIQSVPEPIEEPAPPTTYTVTVTHGTVDVDGTAAAEGSFEEGATVTVTANNRETENLRFSNWVVTSGNATLEDAYAETTKFAMPKADVTLEAKYTEIQTEPTPAPTYTVTVSGGVVTATGTASGSFEAGKVVQLQANVPAAGMKFSKWSAKTEAGEAIADSMFTAVGETTTNFTVPASNVTVTAEFVPIEYSITVNDGTADYTKAASGTKVKITADEAPEGMEFDYWKVDSGNVTLKNANKATTSFQMPTADVEVSAYYRMKEYHVTVQNGYADNDTYYMGQEVTIYSNYPASGREFDQWKAVSGKVTFGDSSRWKTTFTMPASDVTVSAAYKDGPSPNSNQILDLVAGGEYITDSTIKFTAAGAGMDNSNPNPGDYRYRPTGYQIGNVTGSWQAAPYTTSMSIKARGDYTLKVNYAKDVFDGTNWVPDGTTDTRSVTFRVLTPAEAVKTGDETPIAIMVVLAGASCLLFLLLLSVFIRRRKRS